MSFKISPISPEQVKQLCYGEVKIDETLSFKSKLPVKDGLFCQKIFGPIKDYTCECGKYQGFKYEGKVCEVCEVNIINSNSRSERMGYIDLQLPIVNPMATKAIISILGVKQIQLESYLKDKYCFVFDTKTNNKNIVLKNGIFGRVKFVKINDPKIDRTTYYQASICIYNLFDQINLKETIKINDSKYLKLYEKENFNLINLFLKYLPVSPPNHRALVEMNNYFASDSKNDLYLRIVRRSIRLKRVIELNALKEMICHESNLIYKAVCALFFGGSFDTSKNELKGILKSFTKKEGLLRKNILAKRVDYSGRSVITSSGSTLEMDEIGLPKKLAYELFKPFIISEINEKYAETFKEAETIYKEKPSIAIKAMEKVVKGRRILMNRAPTLHRYGIMSFKIKLVEGKTILFHPMMCVPFNADFDGDQVAIHVPLSDRALTEACDIMSPEFNILSSLDGQPQLNPSHEMVIGLNIITTVKSNGRFDNKIFNSLIELDYLHSTYDKDNNRQLKINEQIKWKNSKGIKTTCYGRLLLENLFRTDNLPEKFTKNSIKNLISEIYEKFEPLEVLRVLNKVMKISLDYATLSGFSVSSKDCIVPSTKKEKIRLTVIKIDENIEKFKDGEISEETRYEDNIRLWNDLINELQEDWKNEVGEDNPVKLMQSTGARVSMSQISQLTVAKGLTTKTTNQIIETPILNSLKEGLTTFEYFTSCSGSRKSMADKADLTPDSGFLTRKMVFAARDFFIVSDDCKTSKGIYKVKKNCSGRFTCDGEFITSNDDKTLVKIRTPIYCEAKKGLCVKCYGIAPWTRKLITIGSNIGTIAAQSLTESTTQMTMKTFHTSGAAVLKDSPLVVKSMIDGKIKITILDAFYKITVSNNEQNLDYYSDIKKSRLQVKDGEEIKVEHILAVYTSEEMKNDDVSGSLPRITALYEASIPAHSKEALIAPKSGVIQLLSVGSKISMSLDQEQISEISEVPIFVANGQIVNKGDILTFGSPNIGTFFKKTDDLETTYAIFENSILNICQMENLFPNPIHLEMIFRSMTNLVLKEDKFLGLRSHGDIGKILLFGVNQVSRVIPSWLKSIGYGYVDKTLQNSAVELRETYNLSSEKLMYGDLIFDAREFEDN